jgi:arylsulfatase A-like enzyme
MRHLFLFPRGCRVHEDIQKTEPRSYVFAARDRVDESYDMIRSVRNKDYLYIRNFYPNEPFHIWIPYLNRMPIMQEVMRLDTENKLNVFQKQWMADKRPAEELYDVNADPYQLTNLADDPKYKEVLDEMREQQKQWTMEIGDNPHWKLYNGPLHLSKGTHSIRIKAVRYGYKSSDVADGVFVIKFRLIHQFWIFSE